MVPPETVEEAFISIVAVLRVSKAADCVRVSCLEMWAW